jgi:hypothetical protein
MKAQQKASNDPKGLRFAFDDDASESSTSHRRVHKALALSNRLVHRTPHNPSQTGLLKATDGTQEKLLKSFQQITFYSSSSPTLLDFFCSHHQKPKSKQTKASRGFSDSCTRRWLIHLITALERQASCFFNPIAFAQLGSQKRKAKAEKFFNFLLALCAPSSKRIGNRRVEGKKLKSF